MFTPTPSARTTQKVCGPPCRALRDNRHARRRRRDDLDEARDDERERQRKHRAATPRPAAPRPPVTPPPEPRRHAPASDEILSKTLKKLIQSWSAASDLSRATLSREIARAIERSVFPRGPRGATTPALSRATLEAQRAAPQAPG